MASVASQLIEEITARAQVTVSRMRERYAQTVLTFRITYVSNITACSFSVCQSQHYPLTVAYGPDLNKKNCYFCCSVISQKMVIELH